MKQINDGKEPNFKVKGRILINNKVDSKEHKKRKEKK